MRSSRQRTRRLLRRCARAFRRHYGSLATLVLLVAALAVVMTNSSFSSGERPDTPDASPPASRIELPPGYQLGIEPATPRVTYYLYEDEEQRALLTGILRRDYTSMARMGLPDYIGEVHFLRISTQEEQDYANFLVNEVVAWAKPNGLTINVVDLR